MKLGCFTPRRDTQGDAHIRGLDRRSTRSQTFFRRGTLVPHPEQIERYVVLRDAVTSAGHDVASPGDAGLDPILAVHEAG